MVPCFIIIQTCSVIALTLEITNPPGMSKVLGSSLTRTCFFVQVGNILFQIKLSSNNLSVDLLSAWMTNLGIVFFCCAHFKGCSKFLIFSCNLYLYLP